MPMSPAVEAPLTDKPFGEPSLIRGALEAKNGPRKRHPGLSYEPLPDQGADLSADEAERVATSPVERRVAQVEPVVDDRRPRHGRVGRCLALADGDVTGRGVAQQ